MYNGDDKVNRRVLHASRSGRRFMRPPNACVGGGGGGDVGVGVGIIVRLNSETCIVMTDDSEVERLKMLLKLICGVGRV